MKIDKSKLYNLYLAIVSLVSIIAITVTLGIVLTSIGKYFMISNEEYLQYREPYRLESCKNPTYQERQNTTETSESGTITRPKTPSDEEIAKCEEKVRKEVSLSRRYNLKNMFITSGSWFIAFLILFVFHYPKFLKVREE